MATVAACLITAGDVRLEFMRSVVDSLLSGALTNFISVPSGPYLDMGRNEATYAFLTQTDCEFMLTVDGDVAWSPDDILTVIDTAERHHRRTGIWPVVAGTYFGVPKGVHSPIAYRRNSRDGMLYSLTIDQATVFAANRPVTRVDAAGTGFLLVHRDILCEIGAVHSPPQQFFAELVEANLITGDMVWYGEDLMFCKRAAKLGHPILLHRGVQLTHYKTLGLKYDPAPRPVKVASDGTQ